VFYFFSREQIKHLICQLADRFPKSSLIFDAQSPWYLQVSNFRHPLSDSRLSFSLVNVQQIKTWDARLRVLKCVGFGDSPYYDAGMPRLSLLRRWGRRLFPSVRHLFKIVHIGW
jgi:hypothetical protein